MASSADEIRGLPDSEMAMSRPLSSFNPRLLPLVRTASRSPETRKRPANPRKQQFRGLKTEAGSSFRYSLSPWRSSLRVSGNCAQVSTGNRESGSQVPYLADERSEARLSCVSRPLDTTLDSSSLCSSSESFQLPARSQPVPHPTYIPLFACRTLILGPP